MAEEQSNKNSGPPKFQIDLRPKLIHLPSFAERQRINIRYPLIPPFAYAHIYWDKKTGEQVYYVEEPKLTPTEKEILKLVQLGLEEMINVSFIKASKTHVILDYLEKNVQSILVELGTKVSNETYQKVMYYIYRDSVGLNEMEPLLHDYYIEDIECNGENYPVYIVHRKFENIRTNIIYKDPQKLIDFVEKLAQKAGRYVSYAKPLLDGTLPDGSRVNATYTEDVTTRGPTFTIRKFTKDPWTPVQLIEQGTADAETFAYLWMAIEHKFNILVIGETAAGKTTFLNAILSFIPPEARICSIEDTRELNLAHSNWLPAVTRSGFGIPNMIGERYGEITLFDLLKESFRQNPDYVIVGEIRGKEAYVLFQGMASGHPSFGTFHAGSVETLVRRLSAPPISLSASLIESLDIVCVTTHIKDQYKSIRRLKELIEIQELKETGGLNTNKVVEWNPMADQLNIVNPSKVFKQIESNTGIPLKELEKEMYYRAELLKILKQKHIMNFRDVNQVINAYYKNPDAVRKKYGIS